MMTTYIASKPMIDYSFSPRRWDSHFWAGVTITAFLYTVGVICGGWWLWVNYLR